MLNEHIRFQLEFLFQSAFIERFHCTVLCTSPSTFSRSLTMLPPDHVSEVNLTLERTEHELKRMEREKEEMGQEVLRLKVCPSVHMCVNGCEEFSRHTYDISNEWGVLRSCKVYEQPFLHR